MAGTGGARQGAGRKPGVPNKATREIKAILDECVDFEGVVNKLVELVDGVTLSETKGEEEIIYTSKPDAQAAKLLLEYRFGKPKQSMEHSGNIEFKNLLIDIVENKGEQTPKPDTKG